MNTIATSDDRKHFFPHAEESVDGLKNDVNKRINTGKSDLANYILKEIVEFKSTGKQIEIDMSKHYSSFPERSEIRSMLYSQGWKVDDCLIKNLIPNWNHIEPAYDSTIHWKITKRE